MSKSKLARAAGIVMIITIISKVIGFLRDTLVANSFGATYQTDAYNMAITIPEILFAVFSLAITTTFIPILSESFKNHGKKEMFKFANNIINILVIISIILTIVGWELSPQLVRIIAPKFRGQTFELTVTLMKISVINILFMTLNGAYTAILQTLDDFTSPALVGIMLNMPIIIYILLGAKAGVIGLTIATVFGNVLKVLVQLPWLVKNGYTYELFIDLKDSRIRKMLLLILPVVIGAGANQINAIIDKTIGSGLPAGSISALNYASRITDVIYISFATAIVTVIYPALSRESSSTSYDNFKIYINKAVNNINLIMIPCTVGLIILSNPLINFLFKHGAFDDRAASMTSIALVCFSVGIPFYGVRDVFNRALYALKDTKSSTFNGILGITINIILNLILVRFIGIGGLALSTSIAAITTTFLLLNSLVRKIGKLNMGPIIINLIKIIISSSVMGLIVKISYSALNSAIGGFSGNLIGITISVFLGVTTYFIQLKIYKVPEFEDILQMIKNKL